jgi:hypothetical protein
MVRTLPAEGGLSSPASGHLSRVLETLPTVQRTTVAGVPVWWAAGDGPVVAAIMFRTGRADETLATSGITHLVEHLALFPLGRRDYVYNGFVDGDRCAFYASGSLEEVADFLRDVCAALTDLPLDRLQAERRLLRTEAQRDSASLMARLLAFRFGAAGYGLPIFDELGLRWLGPDEVGAWAAERFTRENAALWMTAEPPGDLELPLPAGRRFAPPEPRPLDLDYPAAVAEGKGGVALTGVAPRSSGLRVAAAVATDRLLERLRRDRGLAYSPFASADPLDARSAHVVFVADCLDEHAATVRDELWRVVNEVAEHGVTDEEVARIHANAVRGYEHPDALRGELDSLAHDELIGRAHLSAADGLAQFAAVDGPAAASALAPALEAPIFLVPANTAAPDGFHWRDPAEPPRVDGTRYLPPRQGALRRRGAGELVVGREGVTLETERETVTVPWTECVSAERRLDGSLMLFRRDEAWLRIVPEHWERGGDALEEALELVPSEQLITEVEAEVFEQIVRAGATELPERRELAAEVRALPRELGDGETPLALVGAVFGITLGLLVITDGRLLWLREGEQGPQRMAWRWTSLVAVEAATMGELRVIVREHGTERFTIQPGRRTSEIAERAIQQIG